MSDLRVEQGRPSTEVPVLQPKLVLTVVVAMDWDLLLVPVDHHGASGPEAAGQDAVFTHDAADVGVGQDKLELRRLNRCKKAVSSLTGR